MQVGASLPIPLEQRPYNHTTMHGLVKVKISKGERGLIKGYYVHIMSINN